MQINFFCSKHFVISPVTRPPCFTVPCFSLKPNRWFGMAFSESNATSLTKGIYKSLCIFSFITYHGARVMVLRFYNCFLWISSMFELLVYPYSWLPYVHISLIILLHIVTLFSKLNSNSSAAVDCLSYFADNSKVVFIGHEKGWWLGVHGIQ